MRISDVACPLSLTKPAMRGATHLMIAALPYVVSCTCFLIPSPLHFRPPRCLVSGARMMDGPQSPHNLPIEAPLMRELQSPCPDPVFVARECNKLVSQRSIKGDMRPCGIERGWWRVVFPVDPSPLWTTSATSMWCLSPWRAPNVTTAPPGEDEGDPLDWIPDGVRQALDPAAADLKYLCLLNWGSAQVARVPVVANAKLPNSYHVLRVPQRNQVTLPSRRQVCLYFAVSEM